MTDTGAASLSIPRVATALAGILLLAIAVPYAAVVTLHHTRLERADRDMATLAAWVERSVAESGTNSLGDTELLEGPGPRAVSRDERWNTARAMPLTRLARQGAGVLPSDPWGNAYLVLITDGPGGGAARVLSAGPNGIIETPFALEPSTAAGDDRLSSRRPLPARAR